MNQGVNCTLVKMAMGLAVALSLSVAALAQAPTGVATLNSPSGTIATTSPTFGWTEVTGATQYRLYISRGGAEISNQLYTTAAAGCSAGTCSLASPVVLSNGNHSWWIRAVNGSGEGPWSVEKPFTVSSGSAAPTGQPTLTSPSGTVTNSYTPFFTWTEVANATAYDLYVNGQSSVIQNPVINQSVPNSNCSGGTCTIQSPVVLANGNHQVWVRPTNASGSGPWSPPVSFAIAVSATSATLGFPSGTITSTTPTYTWTGVDNAVNYRLFVSGPPGGATIINSLYAAATYCTGSSPGTCSLPSPVTLANGSHTWYIRPAFADTSEGQWSTAKTFTVSSTSVAPTGTATLTSPTGAQGTNMPNFVWTEVTAATGYLVWVNGPSGAVYNFTPTSAICSGGICTLTAPATFATGAHQWWVQANNSAGSGPWSTPLSFTTP